MLVQCDQSVNFIDDFFTDLIWLEDVGKWIELIVDCSSVSIIVRVSTIFTSEDGLHEGAPASELLGIHGSTVVNDDGRFINP